MACYGGDGWGCAEYFGVIRCMKVDTTQSREEEVWVFGADFLPY